MGVTGGGIRALLQEIYVQDLVLSIYAVYVRRLADPGGRALIETYIGAEEDRRRRLLRYLAGREVIPGHFVRRLFATVGRIYGRLTASLGTRVMLRIALSGSRRAARRACAGLARSDEPDLVYLATLRARNEGDLLDSLRQHLIDTRPRRA